MQLPNITGKTPAEQIAQIRSFLHILVENLNLQEESGNNALRNTGIALANAGGKSDKDATPISTFNQIKDLIIKSADIVDAYETELTERLDGRYVATSEYGVYDRLTHQAIKSNSLQIMRLFTNVQSLQSEMSQVISTQAHIRQGVLFNVGEETLEPELGQNLEDGTPVYGVEVGQTTTVTVEGETVNIFKKFARFTAYGMTLYDNNGKLSAYITDETLNIANAVIKNSLIRGGFVETIASDGSSVERWVGV